MPDTLTCARCRHTWRPRMDTPPLRCPRCGTLKWGAPKGTPESCRLSAGSRGVETPDPLV